MTTQADYRALVLELTAKVREAAETATGDDAYEQGLRMAYYDTLSFVVDQGEALGLSKDDLGDFCQLSYQLTCLDARFRCWTDARITCYVRARPP